MATTNTLKQAIEAVELELVIRQNSVKHYSSLLAELKAKRIHCNHSFVSHYCTECGMCDTEIEHDWTEP